MKKNLIHNYKSNLLVLRCSCSCDDLHQFSGNHGLTGAIEEDLEFINHVSRILGGVLFGACISFDTYL